MAVLLTGAEPIPSIVKPVFADNDWKSVIKACQSGEIPNTWNVGDSLNMDIGGASYQIDIIGKNHDDYTDGTGKAPLTFQMHDCYETSHQMNSTYTNAGGWKDCLMRTTTLPSILALMPTEVQNGIREVNKKASAGNTSSTINTTPDKLFLLSEIEVRGSAIYSKSGEGTQYTYYANNGSTKKYRLAAPVSWWLRSPRSNSTESFCCFDANGQITSFGAINEFGVSFAFCF